MKVPFQQTTKAGCYSLCIANLFNDERFAQGLEFINFGEYQASINFKMQQLQLPYFLDTVFTTSSTFKKQGTRVKDPAILTPNYDEKVKDTFAYPMIATVNRGDNAGRIHAILIIYNCKTQNLHICNSLDSEIVVTNIETFLSFYCVTGIEHFCSWDSARKQEQHTTIMIHKHHFPHLFNGE